MELAQLRSGLRARGRVGPDPCIFIYQWKAHPRYSPVTDFIFSSLEQSDFGGISSTITMTELLVHPYRAHDVVGVSEPFGLLSTYPSLEWIAPSLEIADLAAQWPFTACEPPTLCKPRPRCTLVPRRW